MHGMGPDRLYHCLATVVIMSKKMVSSAKDKRERREKREERREKREERERETPIKSSVAIVLEWCILLQCIYVRKSRSY
jgi:predicted Holliday junction resolvase-like endonuclease